MSNEVRLIDANALKEEVNKKNVVGRFNTLALIDNAPTVEYPDVKEIIDVIHKTIYQFFDVCIDDEETPISDKDKLLLEVNKAICNAIKALECTSQAENVIEIENTFENGRFCKTCKHYIPNADDLSERCYDCLLSNFGDKAVRENAKLWKYPNWEAEND